MPQGLVAAPVDLDIVPGPPLREDNLGALEVDFDAQQLTRLEQASAVDLGFPHEFLNRPMTQNVTFGDLTVQGRG
jgi:hypothetical protein